MFPILIVLLEIHMLAGWSKFLTPRQTTAAAAAAAGATSITCSFAYLQFSILELIPLTTDSIIC